ncbi:MAG TPA: YfjP family GTPase [Streptosporangiaceae bacterium]|nr:YfjP family GTPase [Streptosporangiaceae bacterium]
MSDYQTDLPPAPEAGIWPPARPAAIAPGVRAGLAARLTALARLIQIGAARIGPEGFDLALLEAAEDLLARAGERLRLSSEHTVVALAGGTGSGKSSLFNALAGADLSPVGVTRPMTVAPLACVWQTDGAGPLLDWLGVPRRNRYGRASALDSGEESLAGLVLLDLPDHDSVVAGSSAEVDRIVGLADLMIWVLDPQKYADGAVHRRYLAPLAGHSAVTTVVLNQTDQLTGQEAEECVADLRRLLDSDDFRDPKVLLTSARTGTGLDELRKVLIDAVTARHAASERIAADVDALLPRFAAYQAADPVVSAVDADYAARLVDAFAAAAGVAAVGDGFQSAYELRATDYVGWPVARLAERLPGRDPVRNMHLGDLREELRGMVGGPVGAQQADIDNTLSALAGDICVSLPKPWSRTVRTAARSQADQIPADLGSALKESLPVANRIPSWWRLVRVWQWALIALTIAGLAWLVALLAFGVFGVSGQSTPLLADPTLIPWVCVVIAAILLLGWLTSAGCQNFVAMAAERQRGQIVELMRSRIAAVAQDKVLMPIQQELSEYTRYRDELRSTGLV